MSKLLLGGAVSAALIAGHANASCALSSYIAFSNNTLADANQVNSNFACAAPLWGGTFTGNVGIGITPTSPLHVFTASNIAPSLTYGAPAGAILNSGAQEMAFGTTTTSPYAYWLQVRAWSSLAGPLSINPLGGNVGIGTISPLDGLDVAAGAGITQVWNQYFASNLYYSGGWKYRANGVGGALKLADAGTNGIDFVIAPNNSAGAGAAATVTVPMTILPNGNVGIATTAPSAVLYVNATPTTGFYVSGTSGGTQAWNAVSDARLKKNVVEITGALGLVERLRGVRYEWRSPNERLVGKDLALPLNTPQLGFIAQEVEPVAPEAVNVPDKSSNAPYSLKSDALTPLLVEAVKEQQAEIKSQQAEIDTLRATVEKLQATH